MVLRSRGPLSVGVPGQVWAALMRPADFVAAPTDLGPGGWASRAGEHGHAGTRLGHNDLGGALPDLGGGADQVAECTKRGHRKIDPLVHLVNLTCPLVDGLEMETGEEASGCRIAISSLALAEATGQGSGESRDLCAESAVGRGRRARLHACHLPIAGAEDPGPALVKTVEACRPTHRPMGHDPANRGVAGKASPPRSARRTSTPSTPTGRVTSTGGSASVGFR